MKWEFHPEAEAEFIESAAYYEGEVPGLGRRFGRAVSEALELLFVRSCPRTPQAWILEIPPFPLTKASTRHRVTFGPAKPGERGGGAG